MIATQYINLSMVPGGVLPVLYCSQYDVGRPLGVVVHDSAGAVDLDIYTCTIEATRSDDTAITVGVTTDYEIGVFKTIGTMTNVPDKYPAQLVLTDENGERVASIPFVICVVVAAMDENAEGIEEDASLYQQYTGTVQTIIAEIRSDLETKIAAEQAARAAAVTAEATARANADSTLQSNIDAEASTRATADNTLQSNIDTEASTRAAADTTLQSQINAIASLPSGSTTGDAELINIRVKASSLGGGTASSAGEAVRSQVNSLYDMIGDTKDTYMSLAVGVTESIPSGSNLDSYTTPGNYKITTAAIAQSITNCPDTVGGRLLVMSTSQSGTTAQFYIANASERYKLYLRSKNGSSAEWSDWKRIPTEAEVNAAIEAYAPSIVERCLTLATSDAVTIPTGADLDDYQTPGNFKVTTVAAASDIAHMPVRDAGRLIVMTTTQAGYMFHIYINVASTRPKIYVRCRRGATYGWTDWTQLVQTIDMPTRNAGVSVGTNYLANVKMWGHLFINEIGQSATQVVPSESVFEVQYSKRLGFDIIEGHIQKTADGKYIVMHGVGGKLGYELVKVSDGSFDADTLISSLTYDEIRTNYVYRSEYAKYRIPVSSADEWLTACKIAGMMPLVKCADAGAVNLVKSYFGSNFILYDGTRAQHDGIIMRYVTTLGDTLANAKSAVDTLVSTYGLPLIVATFTISGFTEDELKELVQYTHSLGAFFATANCYYNAALDRIPLVQRAGVDFYASGWEVPYFEDGNIANAIGDLSFTDFTTTGTAANGAITLAAGQTVSLTPTGTVQIGKGQLCVRFSGTISLSMGKYWTVGTGSAHYRLSNDGTHELIFSTIFLNENPGFTLTAVSETTITGITYRCGK